MVVAKGLCKEKISKIFEPLKVVYKSTSAHRDQNNFYHWVMHQRIKPGKKFLLPKPKPIHKNVGKVFKEELLNFNKIPGRVFPLLKKHKTKDTRKILEKSLKKFSGFSALPLTQWHEERKSIKNLIYLHEFAGGKPDDFPVKKLDRLQDMIGQWNDRQIFKRRISASTKIAKSNKQKLLDKLKKQSAELEKKIKSVKF